MKLDSMLQTQCSVQSNFDVLTKSVLEPTHQSPLCCLSLHKYVVSFSLLQSYFKKKTTKKTPQNPQRAENRNQRAETGRTGGEGHPGVPLSPRQSHTQELSVPRDQLLPLPGVGAPQERCSRRFLLPLTHDGDKNTSQITWRTFCASALEQKKTNERIFFFSSL